jgi:hypothetical protein
VLSGGTTTHHEGSRTYTAPFVNSPKNTDLRIFAFSPFSPIAAYSRTNPRPKQIGPGNIAIMSQHMAERDLAIGSLVLGGSFDVVVYD